ncbi:unnamed protein product [Absidia cylindrospora]
MLHCARQHWNRLASRTTPILQQHQQSFHATSASFAKKHPKQIKKENVAKRASQFAEFERTKPSPIVSRHAPFFSTLQTPASAYNSQSEQPLYQHFLNSQDQHQLFEQTPRTMWKNFI